MIKLFLLSLLLIPSTVVAKDWVNLGGVSKHFGGSYNSFNLGLGYETERTEFITVGVGLYQNSFRDISTYTMVEALPFKIKNIKIGFVTAAVTGYRYKIAVVAAPTLVYNNFKIIGLMPVSDTKPGIAIHFRVEINK